MEFDNALNLNVIVLLIAIAGFYWRLDRKIEDLRKYVDDKFDGVDSNFKGVNKKFGEVN